MNIKFDNITLRAIELDDLELLREMANDSEIERLVMGFSYPLSKISQQKWYEAVLSDSSNQKWIVEYQNSAVGVIYLSTIDWKNRVAKVGIKLHSLAPKKNGIGTLALQALEEFAFGHMQLHRLETTILDSNEISIKLFTRAGWEKEGTLREAFYNSFQYHDVYLYGLLFNKYLELSKSSNHYSKLIEI